MNFSQCERYKAYLVCKERGHKPSNYMLASNPPWNVCEYCNTKFRYETKKILVEYDQPKELEQNEDHRDYP